MFAQKVSAYTGLSVQAVLDTEAAVYSGQEAIDAGLADELVNSTDAITVMRDALDARKSRLSGGRMTKETQSTTVSATASQADVTDVVPATEGENASAAQPDVNAQITAAVAAENSRIMGILNCEEAHGREEQARVLAETPGIGAHRHSVAIGSHGHTITVNAAGNAENTVKNIAFNYIVRLA
ncbi:S49 family peptidase [Escherichia coli]|nr:S49 family peptidase [Escherichia coli]